MHILSDSVRIIARQIVDELFLVEADSSAPVLPFDGVLWR